MDAIELGLLEVINRTQGKNFTPEQFVADCRGLAREDGILEQSYMCNPLGSAANHIVQWSAIERCRDDYEIERVHLEADDILRRFGQFNPSTQDTRESQIEDFLKECFPLLLSGGSPSPQEERAGERRQSSSLHNSSTPPLRRKFRLGFDVAASGQGDLASIYIGEAKADDLWLRALFTCRTEDWNFLKTVLYYFLRNLKPVEGAGDETGLGRQICWEAATKFSGRFTKVNFASKKHDLGFALMNQLSNADKHFPKNQSDIAADFFALRKSHTGTRWIFTEGRNNLNPNSHCDIAWAAALASHAHTEKQGWVGATVVYDHHDGVNNSNVAAFAKLSPQEQMFWSDDPRIWQRWR